MIQSQSTCKFSQFKKKKKKSFKATCSSPSKLQSKWTAVVPPRSDHLERNLELALSPHVFLVFHDIHIFEKLKSVVF